MEESTPKPSYSTQQASPPPPVDTYQQPTDPHGPNPKYMSKKGAIILLAFLLVLAMGGVMGTFLPSNETPAPNPTSGPSAAAPEVSPSIATFECTSIADVAARLQKDRAAVIHPTLTDDPEAVPVYPPNTQIIVDESTWRSYGNSGGANAKIMPQGQQVSILFSKHEGCWYITQIDQE